MVHSQTGYVFTIRNTTITWRSTKQTHVATSSNQAKILALHEEVCECIWLRVIAKHVQSSNGFNSTNDEPTIIYKDNVAYIKKMKMGFMKGGNTTYIVSMFFFNQQQQEH